MKKKFIEPEIKRIELNLNENIASSQRYPTEKGGFIVYVGFKGCDDIVQDTKHSYGPHITQQSIWNDLNGCFSLSAAEVARIYSMPITNDMY